MTILEKLQKTRVYFDGAMGTRFQEYPHEPGEQFERWNLSHPEIVTGIHREYLDVGCDAVSLNTFGANRLKFGGDTGAIIEGAARCARAALESTTVKKEHYLALDIGPTGKLLEPLGDLPFEEAVSVFAEVVKIGAPLVDVILIETMNDSYETKAALLAAKENSDLPVFVTNVYDASGKLMTGADIRAMVSLLEGLGADALGMNCSLGARQMEGLTPEFIRYASVPVMVTPNAGLPRSEEGRTIYDLSIDEYVSSMKEIARSGARILGGCCGTTPEYLSRVIRETADIPLTEITEKDFSFISSSTHAVEIGPAPVLIGERINPTGKKRLKQALKEKDITYILNEGTTQADKGVQVLDVNVGMPEIDESAMMREVVSALQSVTDLPLQIDTSDAEALEAGMRCYNGKPMVNSVNGKQAVMDAVFPLVKKYGGLVVALTLDEAGIPSKAEERAAIAERIIKEAERYGIRKKDIIVDPLALTVSAEKDSALITLEAIRILKAKGIHTSLGVSNVSFGLPKREFITASFFIMALEAGLNAAIMNPYSAEMMKAYYSYLALKGLDENCSRYIEFAATVEVPVSPAAGAGAGASGRGAAQGSGQDSGQVDIKSESGEKHAGSGDLKNAIIRGLKALAAELCAAALKETEPLKVVNEMIIPALDEVGRSYEEGRSYLPQLLMSAEAATAAFQAVKETLSASGESAKKGKILLATVRGDIHDIGKNIVKVLLENYGFEVMDLGRDVPPEVVLESVLREKITLVGLSALMTTTVGAMEETIALLREKAPGVKVMVGGAVLTDEVAGRIGADFYGSDAMASVRYAERIFSGGGS
ncbi:MAG: homocysteine S-methyltransferase family protein [Lachnospiraceae bacterium]|nr:homocysteine S-methyltransferase family protein [Lachnospiraceae bacterium]